MATYNPNIVIRDVDAHLRRAQREVTKALTLAGKVRDAEKPEGKEQALQTLEARLRALDGLLAPAVITQWRQDHAEVREVQEAPGLPDGLICKKCNEQKDETAYFYDDGHGNYGYTHRCVDCRRTSRKGQPGARAPQKSYNRLREAVHSALGYLSAEDDDQARRIVVELREAIGV